MIKDIQISADLFNKLAEKTYSKSQLLKAIKKAKEYVKKDETMKQVFKDYDLDINEIDYYPIYFKDLDVSAKTDHGIIYLNTKLIEDGLDIKDYSYLIHEITHVLQQTTGDGPTKGSNEGDYLDNKNEIEGFQNQIEYLSEHFGDNEAEDYVENLLEHHEIEDKEEHKDKKEVLLSKI